MLTKFLRPYWLIVLSVVLLSACSGGGGSSGGSNTAPTAVISPLTSPQLIMAVVALDASGSSDTDGDSLTYQWTLTARPTGSSAAISSATNVSASLNPDIPGDYTVSLVVNDGTDNSAAAQASVSFENTTPVANAGPDQAVDLNNTVTLDGTGSTDADGQSLSYTWSITSVPTNSNASLSNSNSTNPTFDADEPGDYTFSLVVNDGFEDSVNADEVIVSTNNVAPVANAGPDQTGLLSGNTATLNGTDSSDIDGDLLTYAWSITDQPSGAATLDDPTSPMPSFVVDTRGQFTLQLVVNDGVLDSSPDTVIINADNTPPIANAGANQTVDLGSPVSLSAAASTDADGDSLTFQWSFTSQPPTSSAALNNTDQITTGFTPDVDGTYVVQLIVNDGINDSNADTVTINGVGGLPIANAGPDQEGIVGQVVTLDGSGSSDPDSDPLSFSWSFNSIPAGSTASLNDPGATFPSFTIDVDGTYIAQLIVNDGNNNSAPDTVVITSNPPPAADAGPDQTIFLGQTAQLDGSGSSDANGDTLTYQWDITSTPVGATANLDDSIVESPILSANTIGDYLLQLTVSDPLQNDTDTVMITIEDGDQDNDGVLSSDEIRIGLDPNDEDSNNNGVLDGDEDFDNDNLINRWETVMGYDIADEDTDNNGILDGDEDFDGDGITNADEIMAGTDPTDPTDPGPSVDDFQTDFFLKESPVLPGGLMEYVISVGNTTDNSTFSNTTLTLTVPAGVTITRNLNISLIGSTSHVGCLNNVTCQEGDQIIWSLGDLTAGDSISLDIQASVDGAVVPGTSITTDLTINATELANPDSLSVVADVVATRPIHFALSASKDAVVADEFFSYRVDIGNASNNPINNGIVALTIPSGVSVESMSHGGTFNAGIVTWNIGTLNPTQVLTRTIEISAAGNSLDATQLIATASLAFDGGPAIYDVVNSLVTIDADHALAIEYELLSTRVIPGGHLEYSVTVSNTKIAGLLNNVIAQLRVPEGVTIVRPIDTALIDSTAHAGCANNVSCGLGDKVEWTFPTLAAGESKTFNVLANVDATVTPGTVIEAPLYIQEDETADQIHLQRSAAVVIDPEVFVTLAPSKDPIAPGESYTYELEIGNASNNAITSVLATVKLPDNLTVTSISHGGSNNGNQISWSVGNLNPAQSVIRSVEVTLDAGALIASNVTAQAQVTYAGGVELDQEILSTVSVSPVLFLNVDYQLISTPVIPNGHLVYSVTVSNTSFASLLQNILIELRVPNGVLITRNIDIAYVDSTGHEGCGNNVTCANGDEIFWTIPQLDAGQSITFNVEADVDAAVDPGTLLSTPLFINADSLGDEIHMTRTAAVVIDPETHFTLTPSQDALAAGDDFSYQVQLGNASNNTLNNSTVLMTLPAGLTVNSISDSGVLNGNTITWSVPSLPPTQAITRTVDVSVSGSIVEGSTLAATARLSHDGGIELDREVAATVTITEDINLEISYQLLTATVVPGGHLTYEVSLNNHSINTIYRDVVLEMRVPDSVTITRNNDIAYLGSSSHNGCANNVTCTNGDEIFWSFAEIDAGESITINIEADVDASLVPGSLIVAPLFISTDDIDDEIQLQRVAQVVLDTGVEVLVSPSDDAINPGDSFTYTINLGNTGGNALNNSELQFTLPAGVSVDSISDSGSELNNIVTWDLSNITGGSSLTRDVTVTVNGAVPVANQLFAKAQLIYDGGNSVDAIAFASVSVNTGLPLDVSFSVEASESPGDAVDIVLSLTNNTAVTVIDNLLVDYRLPNGFQVLRNTDVTPSSTTHVGCSNNTTCLGGDEILWTFPTVAAGDTVVITITGTVLAGTNVGELLNHLVFIEADNVDDSIQRAAVTRVVTP